MNTLHRLTLILCCLPLLLVGQEGGYEPIDWSSQKAGQPGQQDGTLTHPVSESHIMRYRIYAPASLPERRTLGLIIAFHGLNSNETSMTNHAHRALELAGLADQYVVAGGKSAGNGWDPADEERLLQWIDWVMATYPIDQRRVFYWGHSNGGWATSWYGARHHERVAGLVRWCGYGSHTAQVKHPSLGPAYYVVHGDADPTVKVEASRQLRERLLQEELSFVYREIDGANHGSLLNLKEPVPLDAIRWLDGLRHPQIPIDEATKDWLKPFTSRRKAVEAFADGDPWPELIRIGGHWAWKAIEPALKAKEDDTRLSAARACQAVRLAGDATIKALAKLCYDEVPAIRTAAIAAVASHANWNSDLAQQLLAKIATDERKATADDRLQATEALAAVLDLALLGNYDDDPVAFTTILTLLNDDDQAIRTAAFRPLSGLTDDQLGYDPTIADAKERRGALKAWSSWLGEHVGGVPTARR